MKSNTSAEVAPAQAGKHTPGPYFLEGGKRIFARHPKEDGDTLIANCMRCVDAEFIVLACNSHVALLAERDRLREALIDSKFNRKEAL